MAPQGSICVDGSEVIRDGRFCGPWGQAVPDGRRPLELFLRVSSRQGSMPTSAHATTGTRLSGVFKRRRKLFWLASALIFGLDQWSKFVFSTPHCQPGSTIDVIPRLLAFVCHPPNMRGVFGAGPSGPALYVAASAVGLAVIIYFLLHTDEASALPNCALGLICGGALGNLADRLVVGAVRDFIKMALWPFAYNVADAAICVGVGILLFITLLRRDSEITGGNDANP